jgi:hypothetical protein
LLDSFSIVIFGKELIKSYRKFVDLIPLGYIM